MKHQRVFITAWLSICLAMLKCVWDCVSFHHTVGFPVKPVVTAAPFLQLPLLVWSAPSVCSPSVAWDLTGWSSSAPPLQFSAPAFPCPPLNFLNPQCQLIRGGGAVQIPPLAHPLAFFPPFFWAVILNCSPCFSLLIVSNNNRTQRANHRIQPAELCHSPSGQLPPHPTLTTFLIYLCSGAQEPCL